MPMQNFHGEQLRKIGFKCGGQCQESPAVRYFKLDYFSGETTRHDFGILKKSTGQSRLNERGLADRLRKYGLNLNFRR